MTTMTMWYEGEYISAETGEGVTYSEKGYHTVARMLRTMKDGDALVVNAREGDDSEFLRL